MAAALSGPELVCPCSTGTYTRRVCVVPTPEFRRLSSGLLSRRDGLHLNCTAVQGASDLHLLPRELFGRLLIAHLVNIGALEQRIFRASLDAIGDTFRVRLDVHHGVVFPAHGVRNDAGEG